MGIATLTAALTLLVTTAANDPFVGTWRLDPARSDYPPGTCPTAMVIEMAAVEGGVRYRSDATYANGSRLHSEYTARYDGRQVLVTGGRGLMLPVSLKRLDSRTVVASYTKDFVTVATSRRVVSEDGRLLTITTTSLDAARKTTTTVGVYLKQQGARANGAS
ncbi:MAG TPA: hypothetical protein VH458_02115 [Vicinamibacterales bacterium]|jgi:hypothetical protein